MYKGGKYEVYLYNQKRETHLDKSQEIEEKKIIGGHRVNVYLAIKLESREHRVYLDH